ncbi:tetratricopeptide repeat protein 4-like [Dendronephthya gigantea]|uniref:tetratricopeptide repeat protein 4-like n=1 Tax=Dendronephthya gigantea TaxID=151771 RepID=UPI00106D3138|nr:tetratricopeptide repeat protein 4-like [Dendronephthya gigantea]
MAEKESLAAKLDEDVNIYVDKMIEKNKNYRYANPLSEDNWEEELENIPLFMTKSPEEVDPEKAPAIAAMQALKFEEDDPNTKALSYKEDGNEEFKKKNYKKAIKVYTEGIKINCSDTVMSTLYANRANAHFKIGNFRTSLNDATEAKNMQPSYVKAIFRGACACMELELYNDAITWCKEALAYDPDEKSFQDLLKKATLKLKQYERDKRKKKAEESKIKKSKDRLIEVIKNRGVTLRPIPGEENTGNEPDTEDNNLEFDKLRALGLNNQHIPGKGQVILDSDGILHWPVLFVYPEYGQTDFIEAFNENHRFSDHLEVMFSSEAVPWDIDNKYQFSHLEVYFEDVEKNGLVFVSQTTCLANVLSDPRYVVYGGTPSFIILVKDTSFQKQFKSKYRLYHR